ncbi:MAG TPA: class I SAM-dependent methyltransferase [Herpetosiphonaceae bacterium]
MTTQPSVTPNFSAIKTRQQQAWGAGDISVIASPLVGMAENLCEAVELRAGQKVLDIATCTGNVAIAAARRYCEVTGIDYVASFIERARERAAVERLPITFLEGDAEDLPFPDASFDAVLSTLGVMFAPNQEQAASQLVRVCRPGGKIGLINWTPEGFFGKMGKVMAAYTPPPPGLKPPALWGTESYVGTLLGAEVTSLQTKKGYFVHLYRSLEHALEVTCNYFGPAVTALQTLAPDAREQLKHDIRMLFEQENQASDGTVVVPSEYLEVIAVRRGRLGEGASDVGCMACNAGGSLWATGWRGLGMSTP